MSELTLESVSPVAPESVETAARRARNTRYWLLAMVLAALVIRVAVSLFVYDDLLDPRRDHWPFGFETGRIAKAIVTGHGFSDPLFGHSGPSAWLAPVYPYVLAGVFKIFGLYSAASAIAVLVLNSILSALTCLPIFFIARKSFGAAVAVWAGWLWVVFPYSIFVAANWVWDSCLGTLLFSLLFLMTLDLDRPKSWRTWAGYGLLWGFTALTNPVVLASAPFLIGWCCYRLHRSGARWLLRAGTAGLAAVVAMSPWLIRNYRVFHQPVFIKDNLWLEIRVGNSGDFLHWWNDYAHPSHSDAEMNELVRVGEIRYMAEKRAQVLDFVKQRPGFFVVRCVRRFIYVWTGFWSFNLEYLREEPFDPVNIIFCSAWTVLAALGLMQAFRTRNETAMPYLLALLTLPSAYYITHPHIRYRHPIDPLIIILSAYVVAPYLHAAGSGWLNRAANLRRIAFRKKLAAPDSCSASAS